MSVVVLMEDEKSSLKTLLVSIVFKNDCPVIRTLTVEAILLRAFLVATAA